MQVVGRDKALGINPISITKELGPRNHALKTLSHYTRRRVRRVSVLGQGPRAQGLTKPQFTCDRGFYGPSILRTVEVSVGTGGLGPRLLDRV